MPAQQPQGPSGVPLRDYMDSLFAEYLRTNEQAERERTRAAEALANTLSRSIEEGDDRLREHIANQVEQIRATIEAGERINIERVKKLEGDDEALLRLIDQRFSSTKEAVDKAEVATDKRFSSVNEFRAQLSDQTASFLPREVAEAQFAELRKQLNSNTDRLNRGEGQHSGISDYRAQIVAFGAVLVAVASLLAALLH